MFKKILDFSLKHKIITIVIAITVIIGSYQCVKFISRNDDSVGYIFAQAQKGTLVASISGVGLVSAFSQADIRPRISGELLALYVSSEQEVRKGQLIAVLDDRNAKRTLSDAENSLAQAERDLERAQRAFENIEEDTEKILIQAFDDGYAEVSTSFFKLSSHIKNLQDVLGTEQNSVENVGYYRIILGRDSPIIQKFLNNYYETKEAYEKNFVFFRGVFRDDERDVIYELMKETLETAEMISRTLESVRHMFDAIVLGDYERLNIASQINSLKSKVESDLSSIFSTINSLRRNIDIIDKTVESVPDDIIDAELAFKTAQEKLEERKLRLAEAKTRLSDHYIYAPFDGIVVQVNEDIKRGDSISSGTVLATLVTRQKVAELTLNEIDIAKVKTGQKATLAFDALPNLKVSGKVVEIDTLGKVTQGVVSYGVKIAFDIDVEEVKPGMSVIADIITDSKTEVLFVPNSAVKWEGGTHYVEVVGDGDREMAFAADARGAILSTFPLRQTVEIGLVGDRFTEIEKGLNEGDVVVSSVIRLDSAPVNQIQGTQQIQMPGMGATRTFR